MHIEYEISERDYLNAQRLAIKNYPRRSVRWTRIGLPVFGLVLLLGFIFNFVLTIVVQKQAFPFVSMVGLLIPAFFISSPLLNNRSQRKLYAKSTSLHGKLSLSANAGALEFHGPNFQSKVDWSVFDSFFEDRDSFVLFQKTLVFNMIPKRQLSDEQVAALRDLFSSNLKKPI